MKHIAKHHRRESGTSLVETLIATVILGIVSLSILGLFSHAAHLNSTGSTYTALNNLAKDQLEMLMGLPFADANLVAGTTTASISDPPLEISTVITDHLLNAGTSQVQTVIDTATANGNVKVIEVTCTSTSDVGFGQRTVTVVAVKVEQ